MQWEDGLGGKWPLTMQGLQVVEKHRIPAAGGDQKLGQCHGNPLVVVART